MTDVYYRPHQQATLIGLETDYGTPVAGTLDVGLVQSLSFDEKNALATHHNLGARGPLSITAGTYEGTGSLTTQFQHGRLIDYAMGAVSHDATKDPDFKHTFTIGTSLPSFSLHDGYNASTEVLQTYNGCMVTDQTFNVALNEPITMTTNFLYKSVDDLTTASAAVIDTLPVLKANQATMTISSAIAGVQSFEFKISTGAGSHKTLGSREIASATAGMVDYDFTATLQFLNQTEYERFLGSTTPSTTQPSDFTISLNASNSVTAGSGRREIDISLANAQYDTAGRAVNVGDEMVVQTFVGKGKTATIFCYDDIAEASWE